MDAKQQAKKQSVMQVATQHDRCSVYYRYKRGTTKAELYDSGSNMIKAGKASRGRRPSMTDATLYDRARDT